MKKLASLLLAALVMATLLPVGAAFGWEEDLGNTLHFGDAITVWELGTWLSFDGSEVVITQKTGEAYYLGLEIAGDIECHAATLELQDGTVYPAEHYTQSADGNICVLLPLYKIPIDEPYRAEFPFVIIRGDTGAFWSLQTYDENGKSIQWMTKANYDATYTPYSPNEPSGIDYLALTTSTPKDEPNTTLSTWAVEPVAAAIAAGLVPQGLQQSYAQATTRAEFCALAVALYENLKGDITGRTTFSDTADVNIEKAAAIGVVAGVGDGRFNPDGALTREQAATMLARLAEALGAPLIAAKPTFGDSASISIWAYDSVGQVQAAGIMGGVGDNLFSPKTAYTREQSIVTLWRLYGMMR